MRLCFSISRSVVGSIGGTSEVRMVGSAGFALGVPLSGVPGRLNCALQIIEHASAVAAKLQRAVMAAATPPGFVLTGLAPAAPAAPPGETTCHCPPCAFRAEAAAPIRLVARLHCAAAGRAPARQ